MRKYFQFGKTFILACLPLLLFGCSRGLGSTTAAKKTKASDPIPVAIAKAAEKNMPVEIRAVGNVQAYSVVTIRSQITGQLTKIHFQEGQEVKAGDVLFTIDPRPFAGMLDQAKANLARDEANLQNARIEYERDKSLLDSALISKDIYDKAEGVYNALRATVMATKAGVSNATLNLEFTTIRSPINGRTGNLLVHEGNIVKAPDDQLLTINQIKPIYVSFAVPEQNLPAIRERMQHSALMVEASGETLSAAKPRGALTFIDNGVDPTTGTIQLKATFPNDDNVLWPGEFVQASLRLSEQAHSIVVPSEAIQNGQNGTFVFVVKPDQTVEMRNVLPGMTREGETVVQNGVSVGETVVVDGQLRLVPGAKIVPTPSVNKTEVVKMETLSP